METDEAVEGEDSSASDDSECEFQITSAKVASADVGQTETTVDTLHRM